MAGAQQAGAQLGGLPDIDLAGLDALGQIGNGILGGFSIFARTRLARYWRSRLPP